MSASRPAALVATVIILLVHHVVWQGGWTVRWVRLRCASRKEAQSRAVAVAELADL